MKKNAGLLAIMTLLMTSWVQAQTLDKNTAWLSSNLNRLVKDEGKDSGNAVSNFNFKGCQMNMDVNAGERDLDFNMRLSWLLKDVRNVYYTKENDGKYKLNLEVPADRMKVRLGFGDENSIGGSFNLKNKDNEANTNFSLNTRDEVLVKQMVGKFEESVRVCRNQR